MIHALGRSRSRALDSMDETACVAAIYSHPQSDGRRNALAYVQKGSVWDPSIIHRVRVTFRIQLPNFPLNALIEPPLSFNDSFEVRQNAKLSHNALRVSSDSRACRYLRFFSIVYINRLLL